MKRSAEGSPLTRILVTAVFLFFLASCSGPPMLYPVPSMPVPSPPPAPLQETFVGRLAELPEGELRDRMAALDRLVKILGVDLRQQVVDRPGDAMALRLPGDDHEVVLQQLLDERRVPFGEESTCPR